MAVGIHRRRSLWKIVELIEVDASRMDALEVPFQYLEQLASASACTLASISLSLSGRSNTLHGKSIAETPSSARPVTSKEASTVKSTSTAGKTFLAVVNLPFILMSQE